ncbi:MAG: hypothetical protein JO153_10400 [Solirubrobacterales bacterium]|nr:hypothetical protein [Solirubrobacterales bacterium]MBV9916898.1 hypothetical protein [Solirubrobacterales bacterium]
MSESTHPSHSLFVRTAHHLPGLRRLPLAKLLILGEIAVLARQHISNLEPKERRRFLALMRQGHGRRRNLSPREQEELTALIAKMKPWLFARLVADRLSPVPLPERMVRGRR